MNTTQLTQTIDQLLQKKQDRALRSILVKEEPYTIADALEHLEAGIVKTFGLLPPEVQAQVILQLNEAVRGQVIARLSDFTLARFLHFNDENDAADILQILPEDRRPAILEKIKESERRKIQKLLTYHPETAGGLMDLNFITVPSTDTIVDITHKVQEAIARDRLTPLIVVVNTANQPEGFIPYKNLITRPSRETADKILLDAPIFQSSTDREKVFELLMQERTEVGIVVNPQKKVVGIVRVGDLLPVIQAEATEDIFGFAGVSREEEALDPVRLAVKRRYKWLIINLGTAFLASFVVSRFEGSIAKMAVLASLMPIVAGMGGNAGTQALAVVVRGLATGELNWSKAGRVISKEVATGFLDGVIVAIFAVPGVFLLTGNLKVAIILGTAMIINLVVAGLFGALIPLTLRLMKIDPAVASSVFVTTATDVFGFLTFLGLATLILL